MKNKFNQKEHILLFVSLIVTMGMLFIGNIPQSLSYHYFADERTMLAIPNFMNVASNALLLVVGVTGFVLIITHKIRSGFYQANLLFFVAILVTAIGSAYYHYNPNGETLVWDRLPMTMAFMAFFSIVMDEIVSPTFSKKALMPLVLIGAISIAHWQFTKHIGKEDLRLYVLVQYLPMLLIFLILILYKHSPFKIITGLVFIVYLIAKTCELMDSAIYEALKIISGHSLKHLFAGIAPLLYLRYLIKQKKSLY